MLTFKEMINKIAKEDNCIEKTEELIKRLLEFGFEIDEENIMGVTWLKLQDNPFITDLKVEVRTIGEVLVWEHYIISPTKILHLNEHTVDEVFKEICKLVEELLPKVKRS